MHLDTDRILRETFVVRIERHPSIGSTSNRAADCAMQSDGDFPLLVIADRQTAGRGRGSNRWWAGPGSLMFSLAVDAQTVGADRGPAPLTSLAVGLAVVDSIAPLLPLHRVGLHWPNDVMADGRKVSGILVEALANRRHVLGIGLNTNNTMADAPPELHGLATTLRDLAGRDFDHTAILITMLGHLQAEFARLRDTPRSTAASANERCLQQGQLLTLDYGGRTVVGRCLGIAPDGSLRLKTSSGVETFCSGVLRKSPPPSRDAE